MAYNPSAYNNYNMGMQYQSMFNKGNASQKSQASSLGSNIGMSPTGNRYVNVQSQMPKPQTSDYVSYKGSDAQIGSQPIAYNMQTIAYNTGNNDPSGQTVRALGQNAPSNPQPTLQKQDFNFDGTTNYSMALPSYSDLIGLTAQNIDTKAVDPTQFVLNNVQASAKAVDAKTVANDKVNALNNDYQNKINRAIASGDFNTAQALYTQGQKAGASGVFIPFIGTQADSSDYLPTNYNTLMTPEQIRKYADAKKNAYYNDQLAQYMQSINRYNDLIGGLDTEDNIRGRANRTAEMKYADAILQNLQSAQKAQSEYGLDMNDLERQYGQNEKKLEKVRNEQLARAKADLAARGMLDSSVFDSMSLDINGDANENLTSMLGEKQSNINRLTVQLNNLVNSVNQNAASLTARQQDEAASMFQDLWGQREKERQDYQQGITEAYNGIGRAKNNSNSMGDEVYNDMFGRNQALQEQRNEAARQERARQESMALQREQMANAQRQQALDNQYRDKAYKDSRADAAATANYKQMQKQYELEKQQQLDGFVTNTLQQDFLDWAKGTGKGGKDNLSYTQRQALQSGKNKNEYLKIINSYAKATGQQLKPEEALRLYNKMLSQNYNYGVDTTLSEKEWNKRNSNEAKAREQEKNKKKNDKFKQDFGGFY